VTSTLQIPAGTRIVGEGWSVIAGKGAAFQDVNNPQVVVQVGASGSSGLVEITDIIFSTIGPGSSVFFFLFSDELLSLTLSRSSPGCHRC
jgi:hypothetical protein